MTRTLKLVLLAVVALVVLVPAGTWVYINVIQEDPPERLTLENDAGTTGTTTATPATTTAQGPLAGTWRPTDASQFGYRVKEILFGQDATAVGRTNKVTGSMRIDGNRVSAVDLTVDMASMTSDQSRRDNQFRGRIMDVETFPTSTFELTKPFDIPATTGSEVVTVEATGDLTLRGTTKSVTVPLKANRNGDLVQVNGTIPIAFDDWGIPSPSFGPAEVQDRGDLEFLVVFQRG